MKESNLSFSEGWDPIPVSSQSKDQYAFLLSLSFIADESRSRDLVSSSPFHSATARTAETPSYQRMAHPIKSKKEVSKKTDEKGLSLSTFLSGLSFSPKEASRSSPLRGSSSSLAGALLS